MPSVAYSQKPNWSSLYETAEVQDGYFTTAQAANAGYSPQLLAKYLKNQRVVRERRGIYRLAHFPAGQREDLVVFWLWSEQLGVFSHETALSLHQLSDVLPSTAEMTVPVAWQARRLRVPEGLSLNFADIPVSARKWKGPVPVTSPARTLLDCAEVHLSPELLSQAVDEGLARGLFSRDEIAPVLTHLRPYRT